MPISAVLITRNEEKNIRDCLESVAFCDEMIVIDSGSCDRTVEIARSMGARVFQNDFKDFASQKNFGIEKAVFEWVLLIDADERVSAGLAQEIQETIGRPSARGYFLRRKNRIFGRWMRHGSNRADYQLRLVKRECAHFEGTVHERICLKEKTLKLRDHLLHDSKETVSGRVKKLNYYTSLDSGILSRKGARPTLARMRSRPITIFLYRFFWQGAVMDGLEGFLFSVFNGYYELVRLAKQWELESKNG